MVHTVDCQQVRAALSARLDGEDSPIPDELLDAHLEACEDCQRWYATVTALGRQLTMGSVGSVPSTVAPAPRDSSALVDSIMGAAAEQPSITVGMRRRSLPLAVGRGALGLLAVAYVVWGVALLFMNAADVDAFVGDATTVRLALAGGLAWAAWRPKVASAVLPIYLGLFAFGAGFTARDIVMGLVGAQLEQTSPAGHPVWTLLLYGLAVAALVTVWLGRIHMVAPLKQSVRALLAQPINTSPGDVRRNSTYRPGDANRPYLG